MFNGETSTFKRLLAAIFGAGAIIGVAILGLSLITSTKNYIAPPELMEAIANDNGFEWASYCILTIPENIDPTDDQLNRFSTKECFGPPSDNPLVFTLRSGYIIFDFWAIPEPDINEIISTLKTHHPLIDFKGVKIIETPEVK